MITATTAEELFIGAGDIYCDDALLGATMDNNVFRLVQEKGSPKLNGAPGPIEGTDYIASETAEIECTIPQVSGEILALAIPGSTSVAGDATGNAKAGGASTTLAAEAAAGAQNIKVTAVDNMSQGDVLMIGAAGSREFRTIVTVGTAGGGGTGVDLDYPLTKTHANAAAVVEVDSTTLATDAPAGSTNIKLASVAGLVVGDVLRFGFPGEEEARVLTFVGTATGAGTGVSFSFPTLHRHRLGDAALETTSIGGATITSTAGLSRRIASTNYHKWELVVGGLDGRQRRFRLLQALMVGKPEFEASDDPTKPLAPRLTLQARWDPNDGQNGTKSPWEIESVDATA